MSTGSSIEWTDRTWNPTVGCMKVSAGCENCYAIRTAYRLAAIGQEPYQGLTRKLPDGSVNWTGKVRVLPERLELPLSWKKPSRIFVDSMSDLFHEDVDDEFVDQVFAVMAWTPQHTYQVLTKRPDRMLAYLARPDRLQEIGSAMCDACQRVRGHLCDYGNDDCQPDMPLLPFENVWLGVSVEDQRAANERIPLLLQTRAAVRFLSCEPLIGPVDLSGWLSRGMGCDGMCDEDAPGTCQRPEHRRRRLDWVIAGGESGPNFRPMDLDWARSLRDQCAAAGVAFHYKQAGGRTHAAGGRLLDGRTWDEYPVIAA